MEKELIDNLINVYGFLLMLLAIGLGFQFSGYLEFRKGAVEGKYNDWWIILVLPLTPFLVAGSMIGITQLFLKNKNKEMMLSMVVGLGCWIFVALNYWKGG